MADYTYREIGILTDLWLGHLSHGEHFIARQNGIFAVNYDTLIEKGMVERVPEFSEAQLKANQDAVDSLKFEAMAALHVDTIRRAIEYLEDAEGIPTQQRWGYRLTEKGIQHMQAQTDTIPDHANA
jgi:hypothetical protein